jgi:hypothetical protein
MLVIDTHIHVYPHYDVAAVLSAVRRNARLAVPQDDSFTAALVLVERAETDVFGDWREGRRLPEGVTVNGIDQTALRLAFPDGGRLIVLAGRQIACRERVEVLGLGCQVEIADGTPAEEAIAGIAAAGGVPVLAWGVGKWMFGRARVVRRLLKRFGPAHLLLGDTSLRPVFWPEPMLMRRARRAGRRVLAGSDTLPPAGEERMAGRYVTFLETSCPPGGTVSDWIRGALRNPAVRLGVAGRRNSLREFISRMTGIAPQS